MFECGEGGLEGDGENDGVFVITLTEKFDAVAVESADVVRKIAPETGEFVAVETADFDRAFGGDVGDTGGGVGDGAVCGAAGGEDGGEVNGAAVEDDLVLRVETGAQETGRGEGIILTVLAPGVTVDDGEGEDLLAAVGWEEGIELLRRLNFTVSLDCGLLDCFGLLGLFGGDFGSDEGMRGAWRVGEGCCVSLERAVRVYLCGAGALFLIVVLGCLGGGSAFYWG